MHPPRGWREDVVVDRRLGATDTTAQVHPGAFTAALMRAAQAQGAELRLGEVTGVVGGQGGERVTRRGGRRARPWRATRSSSPWARGRCWRRAGCRCPPCSA